MKQKSIETRFFYFSCSFCSEGKVQSFCGWDTIPTLICQWYTNPITESQYIQNRGLNASPK